MQKTRDRANLRTNLLQSLIPLVLTGIILVGPVLSSIPNSVSIPSTGVIITVSPLHVDGRYIKDLLNRIVILRGVNCGGGADAPNGVWGGTAFPTYSYWTSHQDLVAAQLDAIKSWGANAIRFMPASVYWINNVQNHQQMVKDLANLLAQRGMYLIYEGGWEVNVGGPADPLPYPPYQTSPDASSIIPSKQAYIDYMLDIATELQNYANVIIGFWNEPNTGSGGTLSDWVGVMQQTTDAIRNAGISNLILAQWNYGVWCNLQFPPPAPPRASTPGTCSTMEWAYFNPLNGSNIVYQTHMYAGAGTNAYDYSDLENAMRYEWIDYMTYNMSKPLLVGEVGANMWKTGQDLTNELSSFNNTLGLLNSKNIGYIAWEWRTGVTYQLITSNNPSYTPSSAGTILKSQIAAIPAFLPS